MFWTLGSPHGSGPSVFNGVLELDNADQLLLSTQDLVTGPDILFLGRSNDHVWI